MLGVKVIYLPVTNGISSTTIYKELTSITRKDIDKLYWQYHNTFEEVPTVREFYEGFIKFIFTPKPRWRKDDEWT